MSLQSFPPSVANTMLGICYTFVVLCCSVDGCYAVECGVACCIAQHTAIAALTRWLGCGPEHDEWIHEEDLADRAEAMLKQYKDIHGLH